MAGRIAITLAVCVYGALFALAVVPYAVAMVLASVASGFYRLARRQRARQGVD